MGTSPTLAKQLAFAVGREAVQRARRAICIVIRERRCMIVSSR
jgi:hypothetical protein